jgi:acyl carrier protein
VTREEIHAVVCEALGDVAPEADLQALDEGVDLRDQLEIDSMDLLNFAIAIHERIGVDIPEADYPRLTTLEGCVSYLLKRLG